MESSLNITEFITFWYTQGRPPVSVFPFESGIAQSVAYLAVLIFPIINVMIEFNFSKRLGKKHLPLAMFIYLAFYMLLDAGMTLEYGDVEKLPRPLSMHYFTPLKAILFLAFFGSSARMVELTIRKIFYEKKKTAIKIALLSIYSFLSIVSIGLLINFVKIEFYGNKHGDVIATEEGDTIGSEHPIRKAQPSFSHEQRKDESAINLHDEAQTHPEGSGDLLVIFGSAYPCAKNLRVYVNGEESGTVNLPGRLRIPLTAGVHKIAFGSSQDYVDEITISAGKTYTSINPLIGCKPLHSTELTEILTKEELENMGFK